MEGGVLTRLRTMRFSYNEATRRTTLTFFVKKGAEVKISEKLNNILGFPSSHVTDDNSILVGVTEEVDMDSIITNVFVYCDLVASRPVGDVMVPLLRTVPILDRRSISVFRIYDKPHYLPLSRLSFDTVEMLLTNGMGKPIPFTSGTSVVTLHFRTRKHFDLE
jgi:hypothetical protein